MAHLTRRGPAGTSAMTMASTVTDAAIECPDGNDAPLVATREPGGPWPRPPTRLAGTRRTPPAQGQALAPPDVIDQHRPGLERDRLVNEDGQARRGAGDEAELISNAPTRDGIHPHQH